MNWTHLLLAHNPGHVSRITRERIASIPQMTHGDFNVAHHVRGGVLESTLVVDNDSVHTQHPFSPIVMTICSHSSTDARSALAQEKDPRHIATHSHKISPPLKVAQLSETWLDEEVDVPASSSASPVDTYCSRILARGAEYVYLMEGWVWRRS